MTKQLTATLKSKRVRRIEEAIIMLKMQLLLIGIAIPVTKESILESIVEMKKDRIELWFRFALRKEIIINDDNLISIKYA